MKFKFYKKGFTLLEVILSVFILSLALIASFILIQQSVIGASLNQSQLVAYYLAQEGIENIRNTRDANWLQGEEDWLEGIPLSDEETVTFLDSTTSKFTRKITTETKVDGEGDNYLEVSVVVEWRDRSRDYDVEVITYLYPWYYGE